MAPVLVLVKTVIFAILEVFILSSVGYYLSRKGIIDDKMKRGLNKINVSLFTPALLFSKVAFSLTPQKLAELWIVPVGFVIVTAVSMLVAFLLGPIFRLEKSQTAFAMACAAFGNSNSLPIALMQSLVISVPGLKWGQDDTKDQMLGRALSYLVLYSTLGIILRWSIGVRLLSQAGDGDKGCSQSTNDVTEHHTSAPDQSILSVATAMTQEPESFGSSSRQPMDPEREPLLGNEGDDRDGSTITIRRNVNSAASLNTSPTVTAVEDEMEEGGKKSVKGMQSVDTLSKAKRKKSQSRLQAENEINGVFYSFPNTPSKNTLATSEALSSALNSEDESDEEEEEEDDEDEVWGVPRSRRRLAPDNPFSDYGSRKSRDGLRKSKWQIRKEVAHEKWLIFVKQFNAWIGHPILKVWRGFINFMTVPLWAALASIIVACIPPVQHFLIAHFPPVKDALRSAGNCSVPVTLLTLGAYFYRPEPKGPITTTHSHHQNHHSHEHTLGTITESSRRPSMRTQNYINKRPRLSFSLPKRFGQQRSGTTIMSVTSEEKKIKNQERRTILVSVLARMFIAPALLLPLLAWYCISTGGMNDDPVFVVTAALVIGSPPAITLAQITSAASSETFERWISTTLFISYAFITPVTTIALVTVGLWIDSFQ